MDIAVTSFSRVAKALGAIFTVAIFARVLSAEELGLYFFAFNLFLVLSFLLPFGLGLIALREISAAKQIGELRGLIEYYRAWSLIKALSGFAIVCAIVLYLSNIDHATDYSLAVCWGVVGGILNYKSDCLRGLGRYKLSSVYLNVVPLIVVLPSMLIAYLLGVVFTSTVIISLSIFSVFVPAVLAWKSVSEDISHRYRGVTLTDFKMLYEGGRNISGSAVGIFLPSIAGFLAMLSFGEYESAELGVVQRIIFLIAFPLWLASTVLPARLARAKIDESDDQFKRMLSSASMLILIFSVACVFFIVLFGRDLIYLLSGRVFDDAYYMLVILSVATAIYAIFGVSISAIIIALKGGGLFYSLVLSVGLFFLVFYLFWQSLGVFSLVAAQSAAMISHALVCYIILMRRGLGFSPIFWPFLKEHNK